MQEKKQSLKFQKKVFNVFIFHLKLNRDMLSFQQSRFPTTTQLQQDKQERINMQSATFY